MTHVDLLIIEQHTVDGLDGGLGRFGRLVVNITIATRTTLIIGSDFAGENVAKRRESVVKSLERQTCE